QTSALRSSLKSFQCIFLSNYKQQFVDRLGYRTAREGDPDRLEDLASGHTALFGEVAKALLQGFRSPLDASESLDAGLEGLAVARGILVDLLLRLLIELNELRIQPDGRLFCDVQGGPRARFHGADGAQNGIGSSRGAEFLEMGHDEGQQVGRREGRQVLPVHPLQLGG